MNTSLASDLRPRTLASRVKDRLVAAVVPKHLRRAIFTCSLAAKLSTDTSNKRDHLAQVVCKDLDLVCAYNAMLTPMSWNSRIWGGLADLDLPTEPHGPAIIDAANTILQKAPPSLRYASPRIMFEDIIRTLRTVVRDNQRVPVPI
jgi:hypothetical protein